jgi:hypothetical protein
MGKIEKFLAIPIEVTIGGEVEKIMPFTLEDLPTMNKLGSTDQKIQAEGLQEAIFKIIKQIDLTVTLEQINKIPIKYIEEFSEVIAKINGIDTENARKALIDKLKAK